MWVITHYCAVNPQKKCGKALFTVFPLLVSLLLLLILLFNLALRIMARIKHTARKHTGGKANLGQKRKLKRAVADARWGTAKQTFVEPTAGRLSTHSNQPNRLDYRSKC